MAGAGGRILSKPFTFHSARISLRRLSTASVAPISAGAGAVREPPPPAHFSVGEYLVQSCGLSEKDAEAASPALAHLRSPDKPDAVLRFLRDRGLSGDEIAAMVSGKPRLLCLSAKADLLGKFELLVSLGFSAAEVAVLLRKTNFLNGLSLSSVEKRVEFLRSIVYNEADVMKLIKNSVSVWRGFKTLKRMVDNITKLREWGVSNEQIKALVIKNPPFFQLESDALDDAAAVAEGEFGVSRNSKMFVKAVVVLTSIREPTRQSKYELFESFGWKKADIVALFRVFPGCLSLGVAHLAKHLDFLMNKAGYTASCFSRCGCMLGMSLERRIIPRYELFCALKANKLSCNRMTMSFYSSACLSEKDFHRRFVKEFMELEPDACQLYMSRCKSVREIEFH